MVLRMWINLQGNEVIIPAEVGVGKFCPCVHRIHWWWSRVWRLRRKREWGGGRESGEGGKEREGRREGGGGREKGRKEGGKGRRKAERREEGREERRGKEGKEAAKVITLEL